MIAYFKIIRPLNLMLIVLAMSLIKFRLFNSVEVPLAMDTFEFGLLVFATLCIAAAGNVINDLYDLEVDAINKPDRIYIGKELSEQAAFNYYLILNILGVASGFWVANLVGKPGLAVLFILCSALLYWYATYLKSVLIISNLVISALVGLSILMMVLFDLYPVMTAHPMPMHFVVAKTILYYSLAAIALNFLRELVKDVQDINGDKNGGRTTLPIVLGISRTAIIVFSIGVFYFFLLLFFCYYELYIHSVLLSYFLFLVGGPLGLFCLKAWQAEKKNDFAQLSLLLKITMFTGVGSLLLIHSLIL